MAGGVAAGEVSAESGPSAVVGRFPFGRPATRRPPRRPSGPAALFVLGVYPSALHVRWALPGGRGVVGALAVDDEPVVFWDGADADQRIAAWQDVVGWRPEWGAVGPTGGNGSSGRGVTEHVLTPLGVEPEQAYFTDCLPTFFVKAGRGSQGARIHDVYDVFAASTGGPLVPADLPTRPAPRALVNRAVAEERDVLLAQVAESAASTIVTLGQEAADVLTALTEQSRLVLDTGPRYGRRRSVCIGARHVDWLALTHPGNRTAAWATRHRQWMADQQHTPLQ